MRFEKGKGFGTTYLRSMYTEGERFLYLFSREIGLNNNSIIVIYESEIVLAFSFFRCKGIFKDYSLDAISALQLREMNGKSIQ